MILDDFLNWVLVLLGRLLQVVAVVVLGLLFVVQFSWVLPSSFLSDFVDRKTLLLMGSEVMVVEEVLKKEKDGVSNKVYNLSVSESSSFCIQNCARRAFSGLPCQSASDLKRKEN